MIKLSSEQEQAADTTIAWATAPRYTGATVRERTRALRGLAGTGKTTTAAEVVRRLASLGTRVSVVAPTGLAARVLQRKDIAATTIHAAHYRLIDTGDAEGGPVFVPRESVAGNPDVVVCDEASMVTREHLDDLLARVPRVLLVGDPGQLPPVSGQPVLADAEGFDLTEVHRQALDSGIVRFAHAIRSGASIRDALRAGAPDVVAGRPRGLPGALLVSRNDHRCRLNVGIRAQVHAGLAERGLVLPAWPIAGDRIVCLSNHRRASGESAWCNGTVGEVVSSTTPERSALVSADSVVGFVALCDDGVTRLAGAWIRQLTSPEVLFATDYDPRKSCRFAWGWALTCHKAQGSEWDEVAVMGDGFGTPDEIRSWRYTAATRAAKKLWWAT